jgi:hypothetical protein
MACPNLPGTLKTSAAVVGGSAVVTMVALGVAIGGKPDADTVAKSKMTVGVTSTQTTPSTVPVIRVASPTIKGPAPLPSEEAAAK